MLSELKAGSDYESLLRQEFKRVSQKEMIPKQQEELFNLEDTLRLQQNLTKSNLNSIIPNSPGLVNSIIQEVINTDGDLIQFNKYFSTFRNALGSIKIRNLDDFNKLWNQFKTQQLGQKLTPTPEVIISSSMSNIADLEKMTTEEIDNLFREAVKAKTGKDVADVDKIQYPMANGSLSNALTLLNKDTIITFDPSPKDSTERNLQARINNVKLRYIYNAFNPTIAMRTIRIRWQLPVTAIPTLTPKPKATGSGLALPQSGNAFALKKKRLGHTRYH